MLAVVLLVNCMVHASKSSNTISTILGNAPSFAMLNSKTLSPVPQKVVVSPEAAQENARNQDHKSEP